MTEKIIMGIDPGTNVMGYGLLKVCGNKASMMAMGVIDMRKMHDPYLRLGRIFERVTGLIEEFSGVNILGVVPDITDLNPAKPGEIINIMINSIDIESIFRIKIPKLNLSL